MILNWFQQKGLKRRINPAWHTINACAGLFVFLLFGYTQLPTPSLFTQTLSPPSAPRIQDCQSLIEPIIQKSGWQEMLANPILSTPAQVDERQALLAQVYNCLENRSDLNADEVMLRRLAEYFLIFAGGLDAPPGSSSLYLVDLAASNDPAVQKMRDEANIPAPPGYVFVRYYDSRQAMPPLVRQVFENPEVAGVTMLTRYIAVLAEKKESWPERALQNQVLPVTLSHELTHAYANATLGLDEYSHLPDWYHEGLAIYFSNSGENHAIFTPNFTLSVTPTADYRQYDLNFKYLQSKLGKPALLEDIRASLEARDANLLLDELGLSDEGQLVRLARSWQAGRTRNRALLGLGIVLITGVWLFSAMPEMRCAYCGHTARQSAFQGGRCPECGRTNRVPRRVEKLPLPSLGSDCQACGRRFWLWKQSELHQHSPPVRIWEQTAGQDVPTTRHLQRVCTNCLAKSETIGAAYHARLRDELPAAVQAARAAYRLWLNRAPPLEEPLPSGATNLPFEQLLNMLVLAALAPRFGALFEHRPTLRIVSRPGQAEALPFLPCPPGHDDVLRTRSQEAGFVARLSGSIRQAGYGQMVIIWQSLPFHR